MKAMGEAGRCCGYYGGHANNNPDSARPRPVFFFETRFHDDESENKIS